ncbi:oxidoreductase [Arthrobacter sp. StoSoilA2]|uniref:SDR family oxidoreductase n=1 Tax=unclassified Arthrobacter TaxID=235627 RepID=UPI001CC5D675|nr:MULTISPECIES: SDR family oxidoreductase [unclassified Arthrobacter]MDR6686359.1 NADP-dependent 3-hydroxy acid dehydrogenase YdfG [Arthrobacter sp. 1088]BCW38148.1 oxidoreductase [Arthrobacter sp. StoSoilA2]BCW50622.1 oxidoreductase [Arthrobacter sp. StoSoilB13]
MSFSDYTTALVTGASTGMGAAIAERLAKRGLTVHAVARNEERLAELADRTGAVPHVVDLTDTTALAAVVSGLKVDVLVNCAGVSRPGNILDSSEEDIDELVDVNLRGLLQLTRLVLPGMVERDLGHVINISSIAGVYNFYGHTVYHATKAAVHQISRQLRNDTVGKRIRVTEICPGRVETEIFGRNMGGTPEAMEEAWKTYYEGYESLTTDDIVNALDYAIETPRHVNVGMLELMPTFQVPGGLTFDRR